VSPQAKRRTWLNVGPAVPTSYFLGDRCMKYVVGLSAHRVAFILTFALFHATAARAKAQGSQPPAEPSKHLVRVSDAIAMTRWADPDYFRGDSSLGRVALFSPDLQKFVIVVRKGIVEQNTNEFSLYLFLTSSVLQSPTPDLVLKMSSSSNRDAIREVRWLPDNATLAFIGENAGETPQVYTFSLKTKRLKRQTNHPTSITAYDITPDCRTIVYEADPAEGKPIPTQKMRSEGVLIQGQRLDELVASRYERGANQEVYLQEEERRAVPITVGQDYHIYRGTFLSLSPKGNYAVVGVNVRHIPEAWGKYRGKVERIVRNHLEGEVSELMVYLLYDTEKHSLAPLLDAPGTALNKPMWDDAGQSVEVSWTYLPLDVSDHTELKKREAATYRIEVKLPSHELREVKKDEGSRRAKTNPPLDVVLDEGLNTPPRIYASDPKATKMTLLLDLNPQFSELDLGRVEVIKYKVNGVTLTGGLYLPSAYQKDTRYPLVVQTHGFNNDRFSMDGSAEWSSAFAARPLTSEGFLVLQVLGLSTEDEYIHFNDGKRFGATSLEAGRNLNVAAIEAAIGYLDQRGLIDADHIGIVGFSISVGHVAYTLTHSMRHFAAASLVDGVDEGYFQGIAYHEWHAAEYYGGNLPFGKGLSIWLQDAPGFRLDRVHCPVRLLALSPPGAMEQWEWYMGLSIQQKPVEFILIPDEGNGDNHLLVKPWERLIAQQGLVDWFRFWLKGEEDPTPTKHDQYARWRKLREKAAIPSQGGQ
jgi:dipeptidyl aminopeptidase/acylaminoacyl peptidase